jgi:hypothetical protein
MTILDSILRTKTGEQMRHEAEAKHRGDREKLAQALDQANAQTAKQRMPLVERRDSAAKELAAAEGALNRAKAKLHAAKLLLAQQDQRAARDRARQEHALRDCAGDELENFLDRVRREADRLRDHRRLETRRTASPNSYSISGGLQYVVTESSNLDLIAARLDALSEAAREAERLASTRAAFESELQSLWRALPSEVAQ